MGAPVNPPTRKPQPPEEPDPLDCCGEGCVRCVYDLYDEALAEYRVALAAWEAGRDAPPSD